MLYKKVKLLNQGYKLKNKIFKKRIIRSDCKV